MADLLTESALSRVRTTLRLTAVVLFVVVVPLFLISTNVRLMVNWPWLYSNGFDKYDIPSRTGIERPEPHLRRGGRSGTTSTTTTS